MACLKRTVGSGAKSLSIVGGMLLIGIMLLIIIDIISRTLFDRPIPGTIGITEVAAAGAVTLGIAEAYKRGRHVAVQIVTMRLPDGLRRAVGLASRTVVVGFLLAWSGAAVRAAYMSFHREDFRRGIVDVLTWPGRSLLAIAAVAMLLTVLTWRPGEGRDSDDVAAGAGL